MPFLYHLTLNQKNGQQTQDLLPSSRLILLHLYHFPRHDRVFRFELIVEDSGGI